MEIIKIIIKYGIILAVVSATAYFIMKEAVEDDLNERGEN